MAAEQTIHLDRYAPDAKSLVAGAQSLADERTHLQVEPLHLLARALERDSGVGEVFRKAGAHPRDLSAEAEAALSRLPKAAGALAYLSHSMLQLLERAEKEAAGETVTIEHLLNALVQEVRGAAGAVLQTFGIGPGALRPHMASFRSTPVKGPAVSTGSPVAVPSVQGVQSGSGEALGKFTLDWVARANAGGFDPVIGRDAEVRRLLQILERRHKQHPLLVGEAGVGKNAIVAALASRIAAGDVPERLARLTIAELDTGALVAGTKLRGEVEDRLKQVFAAARSGPGETVLFISGIESLIGQAGPASNVGDMLKPLLVRGDVRIMATTTSDGLRRIQERDTGLLRRFSVLTIDAPNVEQAIEILRGVASRYEAHHGVRIGDPAIVASVRLAKRYLQDRALPDTAIDLLDEAAARKRVEIAGVPTELDSAIRRLASVKAQMASLADDTDAMSVRTRSRLEDEARGLEPKVLEMRTQWEARRRNLATGDALPVQSVQCASEAALVTEEHVAAVLGDWTGIPIAKMLEAESDKLLKMEERLAARVVGQDEAVRAVSRAVRRGRVGLRDPGKPIGSFLFLGPSGVGKTELAKALAEFLFDDEQSMTRLDMSEFMERHMAQRLVGAPPGYVDSEEGGFLTEAVRRRPYSVLLFDEIEKAHADVFNLLLQVLDDGRLTDGRGRTADFSNTVVVMTSNIGSKRILDSDAAAFESVEGRSSLRSALQDELKALLRPEFLNRIDDIVTFRPLSKGDLRGIVDIQLRRVERMLGDQDLRLELTAAAKDALVDIGYEPAFGARPLKRAILRSIQDPLAEEILAGGYGPGSVVQVDAPNGEFVFTKG